MSSTTVSVGAVLLYSGRHVLIGTKIGLIAICAFNEIACGNLPKLITQSASYIFT